jgi:hypothetical protein
MDMASVARRLVLFLMCSCGLVFAVPVLRLSNTVVLVQMPVGGTVPVQTLQAFNIGDGALSLSVSVPPAITWVTASVGAAQSCSNGSVTCCIPLQFTLSPASFACGTYTAEVTVSDPHAVDAPQVVMVRVQVGSPPLSVVDQYLAPGTTSDTFIGHCYFRGADCPITAVTTNAGGTWLAVAVDHLGSTGSFQPYTYYIHLAPPANMAAGTYTGSVAVTNTIDNRSIPVIMRLTTQPIALPSTNQISLRLAQGGPAMTYPFLPSISLNNTGMGTLAVQSVSAAGTGVSAYQYADLAIVTVDPGSLAPGTYTDGRVTIQCNAANCPSRCRSAWRLFRKVRPSSLIRGWWTTPRSLPENQ